jgi:hypothetical protein
MAGNDIRSMTGEIRDILTNKEGPCDRYARFPTGPVEQRHGSTSIRELGYPSHLAAKVRDLWAHRDLGEMTGSFQATVPSHGVVMVTIKP